MSKTLKFKTGSSGLFSMVQYQTDGVTVQDITGYTYDMDFYNNETGLVIVETSIGSGITITDAANGAFEVDAGETIAWPVGLMPIDIKVTPPTGEAAHTETFFIDVELGISK